MKKLREFIEISPSHDLNLTKQICFWCGNILDTIMLGKINDADPKAPQHIYIDFEPCQECAESFSKGILFISCTDKPNEFNTMEISAGIFPDGAWAIVSSEDIKKFFDEKTAQVMINTRRVFLPVETYESLFGKE